MINAKSITCEPCVPVQITAVIVLYRLLPRDSSSYRSLLAAAAKLDPDVCRLHVVLWDNTPGGQHMDERINHVQYIGDGRNFGLANSYNRALEIAVKQNSNWFLTLDQDTDLPEDYLSNLVKIAISLERDHTVGAIVPQIISDKGTMLSPNYFQFGAIARWYARGYVGIPEEPVFAFNSGAMVRVEALEQIGGYDAWFWMDFSDGWMFHRLHMHGKLVYVAGNIHVGHEFSMERRNERMSDERYRNVLIAESAFWDMNMNWLAGCERTLRLALRQLKHAIRKDRSELRRISWEFLWMRLFRTRKYRIQYWREATVGRFGDALESTVLRPRKLKVSVCMAAYNGGKFIDAQLRSILSQLDLQDEVVIVDDCSTDDTVKRIQAVNDGRIRLIQHTVNQGVVATFEDALRSATGDILFLSDDDDIWAPSKVKRYVDVFKARPEVQIVTSKIRLIDDEGTTVIDDRISRNGRFIPGFWNNVYKNHYQGSAMAIRASLLGRVFPFPLRPAFLHDVWIGTRSDLTGGTTAFIEEELLFYRRHNGNHSRHLSFWEQLCVRGKLLCAHVAYAFK
jgi:GT2 family glycosyltransferase